MDLNHSINLIDLKRLLMVVALLLIYAELCATQQIIKMLNNKTLLITGGTGSFGKHCVKYLI